MTQDFVELLQQEIERVMEIHQVELDTRLDRIVGRIAQLETSVIGLTRVVEGIDQLKEDIHRRIAEAELAVRRHTDQQVAPLATELETAKAAIMFLERGGKGE